MGNNKFDIKVGEFHDCRETEPETNGVYLVIFGGLEFETARKNGDVQVMTMKYVVGHGWNCLIKPDGSVSDKNKIEFDRPAYWATIDIVKCPEVDDHDR